MSNPPLPEHYTAVSMGNIWHLHCKVCNRGYSLPKNNNHVGNELALLNHAYSHEPTNTEDDCE